MVSSIVEHAAWAWLKEFIRIEEYRREGGNKNPRFRIELRSMAKPERDLALAIHVRCAACGKRMSPVRQRKSESKRSMSAHLYYAACCPLEVNIGCSRSHAANAEYKRIRDAMRAA